MLIIPSNCDWKLQFLTINQYIYFVKLHFISYSKGLKYYRYIIQNTAMIVVALPLYIMCIVLIVLITINHENNYIIIKYIVI